MSEKITLYSSPSTASFLPHVLLLEADASFELALVEKDKGAHRKEPYLSLNPHGRIPTLVEGELVLFETAAIAFHIADKFPAAKLAPAVGTNERALYYRWMMQLANTLQTEMRSFFYPEEYLTDRSATGGAKGGSHDPAQVADVKAAAEARLGAAFARIDTQLGAQSAQTRGDHPYLLGAHYSAADPYLTMLVRWGRHFQRPPRLMPNIARHSEKVLARPAVQKAFAREGVVAPFL